MVPHYLKRVSVPSVYFKSHTGTGGLASFPSRALEALPFFPLVLEIITGCALDGSAPFRLLKNEIPQGSGLNVECAKFVKLRVF